MTWHILPLADPQHPLWQAHGPDTPLGELSIEKPLGELSIEKNGAELEEIKHRLRAAAYTSNGVNLRKLFGFLAKVH